MSITTSPADRAAMLLHGRYPGFTGDWYPAQSERRPFIITACDLTVLPGVSNMPSYVRVSDDSARTRVLQIPLVLSDNQPAPLGENLPLDTGVEIANGLERLHLAR